MAVPSFNDLRRWVGELFTNEDWDFNFETIASWFSNGQADLVVNSLKVKSGIDADGSTIKNIAPAVNGTDAVSLDMAQTLLNKTSFFKPFSIASGKVNASGGSDFFQKNSDVQMTVLAGGVNPDLTVILSDATVETLTSNTVLTIPTANGTYNIVKEKGEAFTLTAAKVAVGYLFPLTPNAGDYFLDNSCLPFKGFRYDAVGGWQAVAFCWLGSVSKASGSASLIPMPYNQNFYDVTTANNAKPDYSKGSSIYSGYVCPFDGLIYIGGNSDVGVASITINGTYFQVCYDVGDGQSSGNLSMPVSKGDIIAGFQNVRESRFFPCKGVI